MREIRLLLKAGLWRAMGFSGRKNAASDKPGKKVGMAVLTVIVMLSLLIMSFSYSMGMMVMLGSGESRVVAIFAAISAILVFFSSLMRSSGVLFGFKEFDLILSLPVSGTQVAVSRCVMLYAFEFLFCAIIMIPCAAAYALLVPVNAYFWIAFTLALVTLPLLPTALGAFINALAAGAVARFRYKNLIQTVVLFAFMLGVMYVSFQSGTLIVNFGNVGQAIYEKMSLVYPLTRLCEAAVCGQNAPALAGFMIAGLAPFLLFGVYIGKNMLRLRAACGITAKGRVYHARRAQARSPFMALYVKEWKRLGSSSIYMLNCGFGILMLVIAAVAFLFVDMDRLMQSIGMSSESLPLSNIMPTLMGFFVVMTMTTACSISLEGRSIHLLKSLPLRASTIFHAKIAMNLSLTLPAVLLASTSFCIAFQTDGAMTLLMYLTPVCYALFTAFSGLAINLALPKLDWENETVVVKQSASVFVAVMLGMVITFVPLGICSASVHAEQVLITTDALLLLGTAVSAWLAYGWGVKKFNQL